MTAITGTVEATDKTVDNVAGRIIQQVKVHYLETAATVDAGDTIAFDLATVGGTTLLGQDGCSHTTDNSVIVTENSTCSVSTTTVTITITAGTDNDKRIVKLYYI